MHKNWVPVVYRFEQVDSMHIQGTVSALHQHAMVLSRGAMEGEAAIEVALSKEEFSIFGCAWLLRPALISTSQFAPSRVMHGILECRISL